MKKYLIYSLLLSSTLYSSDLELDNLLDTFAKNSDLSQKTKLENSGHTIVFTRDDLDRMMAKNLKDILKSYPILGYKESRFGYPDMLSLGGGLPFSSSPIRIMIDDHEITTAFNGSGFAMLGDIDLGFVDHIEIYALGPSFELSSELTYMLIKLYSKVPSRDQGKKVELYTGSYGNNFQSGYIAEQLDEFSFFTYFSRMDDKRKKYYSFNHPINRDQLRYNFFTSIYKDNYTIKFNGIKNEKHSSINYSSDATPTSDETNYQFYNVGYNYKLDDRLDIKINYSKGDSQSYFADDTPYFCDSNGCYYNTNIDVDESIFSTSTQFTSNINNNRLTLGIGIIAKRFDYTNLKLNGVDMPKDNYTQQNIINFFTENKYLLDENKIITLGIKYNSIKNNGDINDDNIWLARVGYTYTNNNFVSKTFAYNTSSTIEPAIIKSNFSSIDPNLEPQKFEALSQEFKYNYKKNDLKFLISYTEVKDSIYQDLQTNKILNYKTTIDTISGYIDYSYIFNKDNKILFDISYSRSNNIQNIGIYKQYSSYIRSLNTVGRYDIFNEIVYRKDDYRDEGSYDYTLGVNFHKSKDLTYWIKGVNLLDKGYEDTYYRYSIDYQANSVTYYDPIYITPVDRSILIGVEYLF